MFAMHIKNENNSNIITTKQNIQNKTNFKKMISFSNTTTYFKFYNIPLFTNYINTPQYKSSEYREFVIKNKKYDSSKYPINNNKFNLDLAYVGKLKKGCKILTPNPEYQTEPVQNKHFSWLKLKTISGSLIKIVNERLIKIGSIYDAIYYDKYILGDNSPYDVSTLIVINIENTFNDLHKEIFTPIGIEKPKNYLFNNLNIENRKNFIFESFLELFIKIFTISYSDKDTTKIIKKRSSYLTIFANILINHKFTNTSKINITNVNNIFNHLITSEIDSNGRNIYLVDNKIMFNNYDNAYEYINQKIKKVNNKFTQNIKEDILINTYKKYIEHSLIKKEEFKKYYEKNSSNLTNIKNIFISCHGRFNKNSNFFKVPDNIILCNFTPINRFSHFDDNDIRILKNIIFNNENKKDIYTKGLSCFQKNNLFNDCFRYMQVYYNLAPDMNISLEDNDTSRLFKLSGMYFNNSDERFSFELKNNEFIKINSKNWNKNKKEKQSLSNLIFKISSFFRDKKVIIFVNCCRNLNKLIFHYQRKYFNKKFLNSIYIFEKISSLLHFFIDNCDKNIKFIEKTPECYAEFRKISAKDIYRWRSSYRKLNVKSGQIMLFNILNFYDNMLSPKFNYFWLYILSYFERNGILKKIKNKPLLDINAKFYNNKPLILLAIEDDFIHFVKIILNNNANINKIYDNKENSILIIAMLRNDIDLIILLIKHIHYIYDTRNDFNINNEVLIDNKSAKIISKNSNICNITFNNNPNHIVSIKSNKINQKIINKEGYKFLNLNNKTNKNELKLFLNYCLENHRNHGSLKILEIVKIVLNDIKNNKINLTLKEYKSLLNMNNNYYFKKSIIGNTIYNFYF